MNKIELRVQGMSCQKCVAAVSKQLAALPGVSAVEVDLAAARATFAAGEGFDKNTAIEALSDIGFDAE